MWSRALHLYMRTPIPGKVHLGKQSGYMRGSENDEHYTVNYIRNKSV